MTANVIPFRRDLKKVFANLTTLIPSITANEMHARHEQLSIAREEAYAQYEAGFMHPHEIWPITNAIEHFHRIALRAGVPTKIVDEFNTNRFDWKEREEYKASRPKHLRL